MWRAKRRRGRRGIVIIDVILGLTLLTIAGIGWISMMSQTFHSIGQLHTRERELRRASALLDLIAGTWATNDFDARLGIVRVREFEVATTRLAPRLYQVAVGDTLHEAPLLTTTFYAADTSNAAR